ncbi:hypothetical protein [Bacillus cereus]|uniref:hypothetical protein n=1 Tax=Bacillus cereus TaxID=1396 RepID=UPI0034D53507
MNFKIGIHENYIYGYIFASAKFNGALVLDAGEIEYPIDSAEILYGDKFILTIDLESLDYEQVCGVKARVKKDLIF